MDQLQTAMAEEEELDGESLIVVNLFPRRQLRLPFMRLSIINELHFNEPEMQNSLTTWS